jgi:hypothetical protein
MKPQALTVQLVRRLRQVGVIFENPGIRAQNTDHVKLFHVFILNNPCQDDPDYKQIMTILRVLRIKLVFLGFQSA